MASTFAILGLAIFVMICIITPAYFVERYRRDLLREEAAARNCTATSVRWYWRWLGNPRVLLAGPFKFGWFRIGTGFYRVTCRIATGEERVAYAAVGPRRGDWFDIYGTVLAWHWADQQRRVDPMDRNLAILRVIVALVVVVIWLYFQFG
jgi:hypothetical protein